jgi:hypothetical protein
MLAAWKAEIRKSMAQEQSSQKSLRDPLLMGKKLDEVVSTCYPSDGSKHKTRRLAVQSSLNKK